MAVRQDSLAENGVLEADVGIVVGAWFNQAILDAAEGLKWLGNELNMGEYVGKQVAGDPLPCLLEDVAH